MPRLTAEDRRDIVKDFIAQHVYRGQDAPDVATICRHAQAELKTMAGFRAEVFGSRLPPADRKALEAEYRRSLRDHVESFCEAGAFAGLRRARPKARRRR